MNQNNEKQEEDEEYCNPEPPIEIINSKKDDLIGSTMFSKHWLLNLLINLIKVI
jgi:hypothetical protein